MNWFEWSFGDAGWTVPFWFLPLMFLYVVKTSWNNSAENKARANEEPMPENIVNETPSFEPVEGETTFEDKCAILSEVWLNCRNDEEFADFIEYNDLGLPLAYALSNKIALETDRARGFVEEAFDLLLAGYNIEDAGFESFDDILEVVDGAVFGDEYSDEEESVLDEDGDLLEESEQSKPMKQSPDGKKF